MTRPVVVLDAFWRTLDELFSATDQQRLQDRAEVIWGQDAPIPQDVLDRALPMAEVLISASPQVSADTLATAPNLKAVIEVSGAFPDTIDYAACAARGVQVLSCAPGFRQSVAEMGLAMALSGARGLVTEHEAFRSCQEGWLQDAPERDFSLFGADVGFLGFGQIARELTRLMAPFAPVVRAYDPWLSAAQGAQLAPLETMFEHSRCLFVTAAPTATNKGMVSGDLLRRLPDQALLVVLSRAHLVDFDALLAELRSGRIRAAIDVFPTEPLPADHPIRSLPNVILSPHRAAAVKGGRQLIGEMILSDLDALFEGRAERQLSIARLDTVAELAGTGDADKVANMAAEREF